MTQEQLRMQMLAGIITESQYKEKMEEWGGGMPENPNSIFGKIDAKRQAKNAEYNERNKLPVSLRGTLEAGDMVEYDGKKWMVMFIYPDGDLDLKMTQSYRDEMGITKIRDPRAYIEKISRSEIR
jgi:hypothetical protein